MAQAPAEARTVWDDIRRAGEQVGKGAPDECDRMLREALVRWPAAKDRHFVLTTLAQVANYRGQPVEAWHHLDAAALLLGDLTAAERVPFHDARGKLALSLGQIDLAALDFAVHNRVADDAVARYHDTLLALASEDFDRAERNTAQLLASAPSNIDRGDLEVLAATAHWRAAPDAPDRRAEVFARLDRAIEATSQPMVRSFAHLLRAQIELADGDIDAAAAAVERALAVPDGARSADAGPMLAVVQARISLARAVDPAELQARLASLRTAIDADLSIWRALPPRPGGVGILQFAARRDVIATAIAVLRRLHPHDPAAGFDLLLELEAVHTLGRRLGAGPTTLAGIRELLLPADGAILCVLPSWSGAWVFVVTADAILGRELRRVDELRPQVRAAHADLADFDPANRVERTERLRRAGRQVADRLLPPELREPLFRARHIVVVGAGLIEDLAVEILPGPDGGWLGAERAISYLPSFAVGAWLAHRGQQRPPADLDFALFAASAATSAADSGARPFALGDAPAQWLERIAAARAFVGDEATRAAFADLPPAKFTCVLGHGVAAEGPVGDDRRAALAIAGAADASLHCAEVERAGRSAACLLLASCGGSGGPQRRGDDGSNHLAGAFLFGGATAVIAGDNDLELRATIATADRLLLAFAGGASPAEAMRAARAEALAAADADPAQVFALRVHGVAHQPLVVAQQAAGGPWRRGWLVAATLLAIAAAVTSLQARSQARREVAARQ